MRTTLAIFLTLFLVSCIESNPQPSPGKTDAPETPGNETGADTKGSQNLADSDSRFDGAVNLDAREAGPEPTDLNGEMTDALPTDGSDGSSEDTLYPTDGGAPDSIDLHEEDLPADTHETPDEMSVEVVIGDSQLRGGGSYFGECFGACKMDVTVDGDHVNFVASNWDDTIYVDNDGTLTEAGLAKSKELAAALVGVELEEVYGCPDCDDGGGAYVLLRRNGMDSKHDYPFGQPFTALTGCDEFIKELTSALAGCQSTDNIIVGGDCGPLG